MHALALPSGLLLLLASALLAPLAHAYFFITQPTLGTQWVNGQSNVVTWKKGLLDDIPSFDVELARLSSDGLIYVAQSVAAETKGKSLNLHLDNVPAGDDYFLLFLNITHGFTYCVSERFTILASGASPATNAPAQSDAPSATVVSVVGGPDPTAQFATTFPPVTNAARPLVGTGPLWAMTLTAAVALGAGVWTVLG